jgi:DNA-binding winged helix-turn-helix (wHTH) protein
VALVTIYIPFTLTTRPRNLGPVASCDMATAGPALPDRHTNPLVYRLGEQEQSVLSVLLANRGRVISRRELARRAGLANLSERRCDSLLVAIRRALGPNSVVTVRSRGWMLSDDAVDAASTLASDR